MKVKRESENLKIILECRDDDVVGSDILGKIK
jgi:hypothetical protein